MKWMGNLAKGLLYPQASDVSGPVLTVEQGAGVRHAQVTLPPEERLGRDLHLRGIVHDTVL